MKIFQEILAGKSCGKILWENLAGNSCRKILWEILLKIVWEMLWDIPQTDSKLFLKVIFKIYNSSRSTLFSLVNLNKEASRLYAELLLCVCWHTEHI